MRHKEKLFKLLRSAVETPLENAAVEDFIKKVDGDGLKVEQIDEDHQKFNGLVYGRSHNFDRHFFKVITLHRAVWTYYHGEIPDGYVVHHIDGNKSNNDVSNLTIMTSAEHRKLHAGNDSITAASRKKLFKCVVCGKEYEAYNTGNNRYCSERCLERYRRSVGCVETRHCERCGKEFTVYKYKSKRFCSPQCAGASRKLLVVKICPTCGKEFMERPSDPHKYCSTKCYNISQQRRKTLTCPICKKEFEVPLSSKKVFCSHDCASAAMRREFEIRVCPICGKKFAVKPYSHRKYCAPDCTKYAMSSRLIQSKTCDPRQQN